MRNELKLFHYFIQNITFLSNLKKKQGIAWYHNRMVNKFKTFHCSKGEPTILSENFLSNTLVLLHFYLKYGVFISDFYNMTTAEYMTCE